MGNHIMDMSCGEVGDIKYLETGKDLSGIDIIKYR